MWFGDDTCDTMPKWTAIPAARSSAPLLKIRIYAILGVLAFAALGGLFAGITTLTASAPPPPPDVPPVPQATAQAAIAAREYVLGQDLTVPVANGISKKGLDGGAPLGSVNEIAWSGFTLSTDGGRTVEIHRFLVSGELLWELTLTMELVTLTTEIDGPSPILAAAPSLAPVPFPEEPPQKFDWQEFPQIPVTEQLTRSATVWAQAYMSDNRAELLAITGDPSARVYAGLGDFTADETRVVSATGRVDIPELAVVRVEIVATSTNGWTGKQEYDLLVRDIRGGSPLVVAWGPAGTGGALVEFQNALSS